MRENKLPVHYTSAEETRRVRPAADSGDGGVHIPRERVAHVGARPAGDYLADDLSNSVQITLAKRVIKPGSDKAMCLAAQTSIPISDDEISSVSNLGLKLADGTKVAFSLSFFNGEAAQNVTPMREAEPPTPFSAAGSASAASAVAVAPQALPGRRNQYVAYDTERYTKLEEARDSKLGTWLLVSAVVSVTTLYTICNPKWVPSFVAQTVKISKQLSADIKRRANTPLGGTAVTDAAKAGAGMVAGAAGIHGVPTGRNSASAVQPKGETSIYGVARNSVVRGVRPAAPASLRDVDRSAAQHDGSSSGAHRTLASDRDETETRDFMNQGFNQGFTFPTTEMPKAAEAKTSKSKKGFMVPPPPPAPCVLPPEFSFFLMQPAQQHAAPQQQLQQAQAQASPKTPNQAAPRENTPQQSDQELQAADQELQAALRSSLLTVGEWKR